MLKKFKKEEKVSKKKNKLFFVKQLKSFIFIKYINKILIEKKN